MSTTFTPKQDQSAPTAGSHKELYSADAFDVSTGAYPKDSLAFPLSYTSDVSGKYSFFIRAIDDNPLVSFTPASGSYTSAFQVVATANDDADGISSVVLSLTHSNGTVYTPITLVKQANGTYTGQVDPSNYINGVFYATVTAYDTTGHFTALEHDLYFGNPPQITSNDTITMPRASNTQSYAVSVNVAGTNGTTWSLDHSTYTDGSIIKIDNNNATITDSVQSSQSVITRHYDVVYSAPNTPVVTKRITVNITPLAVVYTLAANTNSSTAIGSTFQLSTVYREDGVITPSPDGYTWTITPNFTGAWSASASTWASASGYTSSAINQASGTSATIHNEAGGTGNASIVPATVGAYTITAHAGSAAVATFTLTVVSSIVCPAENCTVNCTANVADCTTNVTCTPDTNTCPSNNKCPSHVASCVNDVAACSSNCPAHAVTCPSNNLTGSCSANNTSVCSPNVGDSCPSNDYSTTIISPAASIVITGYQTGTVPVYEGNFPHDMPVYQGSIDAPISISNLPSGASVVWSYTLINPPVQVTAPPVNLSIANTHATSTSITASWGSAYKYYSIETLAAETSYQINATISHPNWSDVVLTTGITFYPVIQ